MLFSLLLLLLLLSLLISLCCAYPVPLSPEWPAVNSIATKSKSKSKFCALPIFHFPLLVNLLLLVPVITHNRRLINSIYVVIGIGIGILNCPDINSLHQPRTVRASVCTPHTTHAPVPWIMSLRSVSDSQSL